MPAEQNVHDVRAINQSRGGKGEEYDAGNKTPRIYSLDSLYPSSTQ